jgi:hypothetical protein
MKIKISRENMCTEYLSLYVGDIDTVDAGREGQKVSIELQLQIWRKVCKNSVQIQICKIVVRAYQTEYCSSHFHTVQKLPIF